MQVSGARKLDGITCSAETDNGERKPEDAVWHNSPALILRKNKSQNCGPQESKCM